MTPAAAVIVPPLPEPIANKQQLLSMLASKHPKSSFKCQFILDTWKLCNQHPHWQANQLNLPDYHHAATTLYEQQDKLPQAMQEALYLTAAWDYFGATCQKTGTVGYLWAQICSSARKAAKHQAKLHTTDICTFFWPPAQWSDDLQALFALHQCWSFLYAMS